MLSHGYFVQGMYRHVIKIFINSHSSTLSGRQSKKKKVISDGLLGHLFRREVTFVKQILQLDTS